MSKNRQLVGLLFFALMLVLQGCTALGSQPVENQGAMPPVKNGPTLADGSIRHDTDNARVAQLWAAAEKARSAEELDTASRHILQAIEVLPQDAVLLSRAAELQLQMGSTVLAESYAVRSNTFAETNRALLLRNWLIIEHSRELRGDLLGVRTAHKQVQLYQY